MALAEGDLQLVPLSSADDSAHLYQMLVDYKSGKTTFQAHNGAAGFRFMMALLSAKKGQWTIEASEQLMKRPHNLLADILRAQGADIQLTPNSCIISGSELTGGEIEVDISISSQYLSALMLIAPLMKSAPQFILPLHKVSFPYVSMTTHVLRDFGVEFERIGKKLKYKEGIFEIPVVIRSEKDWSSAAFWFELAVLFQGQKFIFPELFAESLQPDSKANDYFGEMGIISQIQHESLVVSGRPIQKKTLQFDMKHCPDLFLPLLLACVGLGQEVKFCGISHLVYKESNRIALAIKNLSNMNVQCSIDESGTFFLSGDQKISEEETIIDHGNDHRMAMAFGILSVRFPQIKIPDMSCVKKSYPEFEKDIAAFKQHIS
ncbi:MAG: hypothetical protein JXR53_08595 [Bacteroidales bacterium]|nr:hypothetical protein [Bacteroidales bacterium]